jgi:hypothetical protein
MTSNNLETYKFYKKGDNWFIDLPDFLLGGGSIDDLQMIDGADKMLDLISENGNSVLLYISSFPFDEADELILIEKCDPFVGGGNYLLKSFEKKEVNKTIWLCQVTEFVFGQIPSKIFFKKVGS